MQRSYGPAAWPQRKCSLRVPYDAHTGIVQNWEHPYDWAIGPTFGLYEVHESLTRPIGSNRSRKLLLSIKFSTHTGSARLSRVLYGPRIVGRLPESCACSSLSTAPLQFQKSAKRIVRAHTAYPAVTNRFTAF